MIQLGAHTRKGPLTWALALINEPYQLVGTAGFEPATP
jgi:hypothetical protein